MRAELGRSPLTDVEEVRGVRDIRGWRQALVEHALSLAGQKEPVRALRVVAPMVREERLRSECLAILGLLRPALAMRFNIVLQRSDDAWPEPWLTDGQFCTVREPPPEIHEQTQAPAAASPRPSGKRLGFGSLEVERLLLHHFLQAASPQGFGELVAQLGLSYLTIARAVVALGEVVERGRYRSVALRYDPPELWLRLRARSREWRQTRYYRDGTGQPRPPEELRRRLKRLGRNDVAVGGAFAALAHCPGLDLVGEPRLDLTWHVAAEQGEPKWLRQLDAGLVATNDPSVATVALHELRRKCSLFSFSQEAGVWLAEPVDCALDLWDVGLEAAANEFIERLRPQPAAANS